MSTFRGTSSHLHISLPAGGSLARRLTFPLLVVALLTVMAALMAVPNQQTASAAPNAANPNGFYLECGDAIVREGDSFEVTLVYLGHQEGSYFGAAWHTDVGTAGTADYEAQDTEFINGSVEETRGGRWDRTFQTLQDNLLEEAETFTVRFSPTDNVVDPDNPLRDEKCEITIRDDDPNITELSIVSEPDAVDDTYIAGDVIEIQASFSTNVDVDEESEDLPSLGLTVGSSQREAEYLRKSATDKVVFGYTVISADSDEDGISMEGGYKDDEDVWHNFDNYQAITASNFTNAAGGSRKAHRAYNGIDTQAGHKVDGSLTRPEVSSIAITSDPGDDDTYVIGDIIEVTVTFSENVVVDNSVALLPQLELDFEGTAKQATYTSTDGANVKFGYFVLLNDADADGIAISADKITLNESSIKSESDVDASLTHSAVAEDSGHKVDGSDTTAPTVASVSIASDPGTDNNYVAGDEIRVSVAFSEPVTVTGTPQLELDFNGTAKTANYQSDEEVVAEGSVRSFVYTVVSGDSDGNGIAIGANKLSLNGGTIRDAAGNDAILTHSEVAAVNGEHTVGGADTTAPTVLSLAITSAAGEDDTYVAGDIIQITVTFSETVIVVGVPQLELSFSSTETRQANYDHTSGANLTFVYTVVEGDRATDGVGVSANKLSLNGGSITDYSENDAVLTHSNMGTNTIHYVNAPDNTPTVSSVAITSDPGDDDTYGNGDTIQVTVTFSEDVTVTGTPQLEIDVGGTAKTASYSSTSGAKVVFSYTVEVGDSDDDGIAIGANKLTLNEGTIRDGTENDATLTHSAVAADSGHKVSAPGGL